MCTSDASEFFSTTTLDQESHKNANLSGDAYVWAEAGSVRLLCTLPLVLPLNQHMQLGTELDQKKQCSNISSRSRATIQRKTRHGNWCIGRTPTHRKLSIIIRARGPYKTAAGQQQGHCSIAPAKDTWSSLVAPRI